MRSKTGLVRLLIVSAVAVAAGVAYWWSDRRLQTLPPVSAIPCRHRDQVLEPGGLTARFLRHQKRISICVEPSGAADDDQWEAALPLKGPDGRWPDELRPPAQRSLGVLVFERPIPPDLPSQRSLQLCPEIRDAFDGRIYRPKCLKLQYLAEDEAWLSLRQEINAWGLREIDDELRRRKWDQDGLTLRQRADEMNSVFLQFQVSNYRWYRLTSIAPDQVLKELELRPDWLAEPAALGLAGRYAFQQGVLARQRGDLRKAFLYFEEAEDSYRRAADPQIANVYLEHANLLQRIGSVAEALDLVEAALRFPRLSETRRRNLYGMLAWLRAQDPWADDSHLAEPEGLLAELPPNPDRPAYANDLINTALLRLRRRDDPRELLSGARSALAEEDCKSDCGRTAEFEAWADLVEGLYYLHAGRPHRAIDYCRRLTEAQDSRVAARAWACAGQANRQLGRLGEADRDYNHALAVHQYTSARSLGLRIPLGPGDRADDYYQAARIKVELGDPAAAWDLLAGLDALSIGERERRRCRDAAVGADRGRWAEIEQQIDRNLVRLTAFPLGTPPDRIDNVRRELQDLYRETPGCKLPPEGRQATTWWGYRAVPLEDEVLLLKRDLSGQVSMTRRTPLQRSDLLKVNQRLIAATADSGTSDEEWRRLLAPLSQALIDGEACRFAELTPYSLHGLLQAVPLAALPVDPDRCQGRIWFGQVTVPLLRPAGLMGALPNGPVSSSKVFVVDPLGDLAAARRQAPVYRRLFPDARILLGPEATIEQMRAALRAGAALLHMDVHGKYDGAFPELSHLVLDRPLTLEELAGLPIPSRLVNLSGCQTARWPTTADSGQYGIAGAFVRVGVPWVVAARSDLVDELAGDFNRVFYQSKPLETSIASAYGKGLRAVMERYPAAAWAALMAVGHPEETDSVPRRRRSE